MRISDWSSDVCSSDLDNAVMRQWGSDAGEERRAFEPGKGVDQDDLRACQASPEHGKEHCPSAGRNQHGRTFAQDDHGRQHEIARSEEHTSELQSLMRNSYAVFCLKKKKRAQTKR